MIGSGFTIAWSAGRTSGRLARAVIGFLVQKFAPGLGDRILFGMDDLPTSRYGRHGEGAGVHRNSTPGRADGKRLYRHNRIALAWVATVPLWEAIALPLRPVQDTGHGRDRLV